MVLRAPRIPLRGESTEYRELRALYDALDLRIEVLEFILGRSPIASVPAGGEPVAEPVTKTISALQAEMDRLKSLWERLEAQKEPDPAPQPYISMDSSPFLPETIEYLSQDPDSLLEECPEGPRMVLRRLLKRLELKNVALDAQIGVRDARIQQLQDDQQPLRSEVAALNGRAERHAATRASMQRKIEQLQAKVKAEAVRNAQWRRDYDALRARTFAPPGREAR